MNKPIMPYIKEKENICAPIIYIVFFFLINKERKKKKKNLYKQYRYKVQAKIIKHAEAWLRG